MVVVHAVALQGIVLDGAVGGCNIRNTPLTSSLLYFPFIGFWVFGMGYHHHTCLTVVYIRVVALYRTLYSPTHVSLPNLSSLF